MQRFSLWCCCLLFAGSTAAAEDQALASGFITIPEGYVFERLQGIDSYVANITGTDGFVIHIDQGAMAGRYADMDSNKDYAFIYTIQIGGMTGVVAMEVSNAGIDNYFVTYPESGLNVYCTDPTSRQLADFYAVAFSYQHAPRIH